MNNLTIVRATAREHGSRSWKGVVNAEFAGRRWTTRCEHQHRKYDMAQHCAEKIAREISGEVQEEATPEEIQLPQPDKALNSGNLRYESQGNGRYIAYDGGTLRHLAQVRRQVDDRGVPSGWVANVFDVDGLLRTDLPSRWGANRAQAVLATLKAAREEVSA